MNKKVLKDPLLIEAKRHRDRFEFAETLALLHQADNKYPNDTTVQYLLAGTYYESKSMNPALEYCDKVLAIDANHKEALELKGIVLKKEGRYDESEACLLRVLELDPAMYDTRKHLASLYYFCKVDYEKGNEQCEYILKYREPDRDTASKKEKKRITHWIGAIAWIYRCGLIKQNKYSEAADIMKYDSRYAASIYNANTYLSNDLEQFQLYYRGGNEKKANEMEERLRIMHNVPEEKMKKYIEEVKTKTFYSSDGEPDIVYM